MIDDKEIGKSAAYLARQEALKEAESQGVTLAHAMRRLKEAMDSTTVKEFAFEGMVIQGTEMTDNKTRLAATKIALDFYEAMPDPKLVIDGDINVMPVIPDEDRELMRQFIEMGKNEFIRKHHAAIREELSSSTDGD